MKILGIETSCDETSAAIVEDGTIILSNVIASSIDLHAKTGGIIPEQAARKQVQSIIPVIQESVKNRGGIEGIDSIAVTIGPGLIGSLLVGVETAKTISTLLGKPIIPVNHLIGHIYANWLDNKRQSKPEFPALALVVSGGHTDLVLLFGHGDIRLLGGTRDDAAGEAFDKTARLLKLGYPGGPSISAEAARYDEKSSKSELNMFPRPMINKKNYDFSFSGLKTSVLRKTQNLDSNLQTQIPQLSAEIQEAIVDVLVHKSLKAMRVFKPKSFLLAGGVAANQRLRDKFNLEINNSKLKIDFYVPPPQLCTDNAAYIAGAAFFNYSPILWSKVNANPSLTIVS